MFKTRRVCFRHSIIRARFEFRASNFGFPLLGIAKLPPQLVARHPKRGIVWASENAAHLAPVRRPDDRAAQVARRRSLLQAISLRPRVHVDVAIRAVVRAQAAADAVALDLNLLPLPIAMDRIDRAPDQAIRIGARPARTGDEPFVDPQPLADQPRDAVMRIAARLGAFVAPRASLEV